MGQICHVLSQSFSGWALHLCIFDPHGLIQIVADSTSVRIPFLVCCFGRSFLAGLLPGRDLLPPNLRHQNGNHDDNPESAPAAPSKSPPWVRRQHLRHHLVGCVGGVRFPLVLVALHPLQWGELAGTEIKAHAGYIQDHMLGYGDSRSVSPLDGGGLVWSSKARCLSRSWYFFLMIDRWLHHTQRPCAYGYIVFVTLFESLQALSAVIFTWGNYRVVWLEMETRFSEVWQNRLWKAGRAALLLVSLFSINYVLLSVAHASVWLKFYRLNSTAYVATITTAFEITTAALLMIFALLTCVTASYTLLYQAKKCDGRSNNAWKVSSLLLPLGSFVTESGLKEPLAVTRCTISILSEVRA